MKKYILKYSLIIFTLLISTMTFAQDPGDFGGDPADTNPLDTPQAPIGDYIWVIALIGILFVFKKLYMKKKISHQI